MNLLLDTHIFLWSMLEPERLSKKVAVELQKQENQLWFSPISSWEIMLLEKKGNVVLDRILPPGSERLSKEYRSKKHELIMKLLFKAVLSNSPIKILLIVCLLRLL